MSHQLAQKRIAIYARYSSALQNDTSAEDQIRRCEKFVKDNGGDIDIDNIFADQAVSGASLQRDGFNRMMAKVRSGAIDLIITEDVSRVTRDVADGTSLFRELRYLEVQLLGVADGVDTTSPTAKMAFTMNSLMSDLYLDTLRDKTLRGLEGRAERGLSTGGLPYGYTSKPLDDGRGGTSGFEVIIDEPHAKVVRAIFRMYLDGKSIAGIAEELNKNEIPPPRSKSKNRRKGWLASTVREMIRNEKYTGRWTFKEKKWRKVPGTNIRRYKKRDDIEVMKMTFEDRRIIPEELWSAVAKRIEEVRAKYAGKGRKNGAPGRQNAYPFSGLLRCGACGAPMSISAGTSARYYRCDDNRRRKTCDNSLSVREDVLKERVLHEIREHFLGPKAVQYLRERIAKLLGEANRGLNLAVQEHRQVIARTERRLANLVDAVAEGQAPRTLLTAISDLERQADREKSELESLIAQLREAIPLPTRDEVVAYASNLTAIVDTNPLAAREAMRQLFEGGKITMCPQEEGHYVAEGTLLPLVPLLRPPVSADKTKKPQEESLLGASSASVAKPLVARGRFTRWTTWFAWKNWFQWCGRPLGTKGHSPCSFWLGVRAPAWLEEAHRKVLIE